MSKRETKKLYVKAEIGLTDALASLVFDHGMGMMEASEYLHK